MDKDLLALLLEAICREGVSSVAVAQKLNTGIGILALLSAPQDFHIRTPSLWVLPQGFKVAAALSFITSTFQAGRRERNRKR